MIWFWGTFILIFLAVSLWVGYVLGKQMVGEEAAQRNLRSAIPIFLLTVVLTILFALFGRYGLTSLYILFSVGTGIWLISWFTRQQNFGQTLLQVGWTVQNKLVFWIGVFELVIAALQTALFLAQISQGMPRFTTMEQEIAKVVFYWMIAIMFVLVGSSTLEFRDKGICFMLTLIAWQRIKSYYWEASKPNTLTLNYKPTFPLLPGFMAIAIPAQHRESVNNILHQRLPDKQRS